MGVIDDTVRKTQRQISKEYNDALQEAIRKNREFLKRARDVETGKIKPPIGLKTDRQIAAWKNGYLRRAAEKFNVVESISAQMSAAGVNVRKRIQTSMSTIYAKSRENVTKLLNKKFPANISPVTKKQAEMLLYRNGKAGAFSKIAFKNLGDSEKIAKRLRNEFAVGLTRGENDKQLIKRIQRVTGMQENDARRVLRTERTHIENLAAQDTAIEHYEKTGVRSRKRWICVFKNSRDSHMLMHGQTVFIDEDFTLPSGEPISYPGDSSAGAAEVCNCQCYLEILED